MDGGIRAVGKQISGVVSAIFIGPSTGDTDDVQSTDYTVFADSGWAEIEVISSGANFAFVTAPGLINSSKIDSNTTYLQGAKIICDHITGFKLSSDSTGHMVIARKKVLY